jgi:hypothetical protein
MFATCSSRPRRLPLAPAVRASVPPFPLRQHRRVTVHGPILKQTADDAKRIEEQFLWTLSRPPTDKYRRTCLKYFKDSPTPQRGYDDLMWSLLNTREFILNHWSSLAKDPAV